MIKDYSVLLVKELNTLTISSELIFVSRLMGHKSICDNGNELKVDRWSAELSWECSDAKKAFLLKTDNRLSEYNSLSNKLDELSPYYEYVFDPVQYDEF